MSPIDSSALATLRRALSPSASVHLPGEPGYSVKRWALNAERPAAIVGHPACAEDVVHMLAFAQGKAPYDTQPALPLAIKCSGHCATAASSCTGGMVVDLNPNMHNLRVDADARLAFIGGGCLWEDVNLATLPQGLACVTGVSPIVGVGGSTLGGGFGWLTGQHGLAIDNLVSATVVTSSGDILTASETTNSDLFWAIRGGGGNFGVVTEFVMRLHEQRSDFYSSTLTFAPSMLESLVPELNAWLSEREPNENAHLMFSLGASGQLEVVLQLAYNGDAVIGAKKFDRFVKLGPTANSSAAMPLYTLNHQQDAYIVAGTNRLVHGNFIPSTSSGLPTTLLKEMFVAWSTFTTENPAAAESAMVIELYHTDKWASVPASATAYANRNPTFNVAYIMTWSDNSFTASAKDETFALDQNITRVREAHFPGQAGAAYTNYLHSANKFTTQQFGESAAKLEQIKAKYDPAGVFGKWFVATKKEEVVTRAIEAVELMCAC